MSDERELTIGDYETEEIAEKAFEDVASGVLNDYFIAQRQCKGQIIHPAAGVDSAGVRIDWVMAPRRSLIDVGWNLGSIGVEVKKSRHKVAKAVCQCIDYRRSLFEMRNGSSIALKQVFIWPFKQGVNALGSIMAQNRIGGVLQSRGAVEFWMDGTRTLRFIPGRDPEVKITTNGYKTGSR